MVDAGTARGGLFAQRHRAARLLDFLPRGATDLVSLDGETVLQFAAAENLEPGSVTANQIRIA